VRCAGVRVGFRFALPDLQRLDPWEDEFDIENVNDIGNLGNDSYEYVEPSVA